MTVTVELGGVVIGPTDWLVLTSREPLTAAVADRIREQIPEPLQGRVLIVSDSFDAYVMQGSA